MSMKKPAGLGMLSCLLVLAVLSAAKDGRDFAGPYEVSNVTDLGEQFQFTLAVRVFNYSDADVAGATITLEDSLLPDKTYASFKGIALPDRESVRLTSTVTIPRREYERWQAGAAPNMWIDYTDSAGNKVRAMVELARMPVGEEQ